MASTVWNAAAGVWLALSPAVTSQTSGNGTESSSVLGSEGWSAAAYLLLPAVVSALATMWARSAGWVWTTVALEVLMLLVLISVAWWYLPGLLLLVAAAVAAVRRSRTPGPTPVVDDG